jgi:hypothetical protein
MSNAEELARLVEEAELKAEQAIDPVAKQLWRAVVEEWREAEALARCETCGSPPAKQT